MSQRKPSQNPPMLWYHSLIQNLGRAHVFFLQLRDPKEYCSDIHTVEYLREMYAEGADPLSATVINDLPIDPLIPPTVETLRGRKRKNRIESQSIVMSKVQKTRSVICPLCNTQGHTRHTCFS